MEMGLSVLLAPITMLTQTCALITILLGVRAPWNAQVRRRDGLDFRDILPAYIGHLTLGGLLLGLVFIDIRLALMLSPISIGLLAAPWLVSWTADAKLGETMRRRGIFGAPLADIEIGKEEDASSGPALGKPPFRRAHERS